MDTGGGFVLPAGKGSSQSLLPRAVGEDDAGAGGPTSSVERRKLSSKQEMRLVAFLDDQFMALVRGFNKRHEPVSSTSSSSSSSIRTVQAYIEAAERILGIITSIPPVGPSAALLVSYLLRFTGDLVDGIQGYETEGEEAQGVATLSVEEQLDLVLWFMVVLDKIWAAVLKGHVVDYKTIKGRASEEAKGAGAKEKIIDGRFTSVVTNGQEGGEGAGTPESKPLVGGKGTSTVGQTDRIRLRNVAVGARDGLFAWMRQQLNRPIPPRIEDDGEDEEELFIEQGDVDQEEEAQEFREHEGATRCSNGAQIRQQQEEDEEDEMEEVDIDKVAKGDDEEEPEPRSHYDDLFARKIDLDDSDDEEEVEARDDEGGGLEPEQGQKRSAEAETSSPSSKRVKREEDEEIPEPPSPTSSLTTAAPTIDMESAATFSGTDAATTMQWDSRFSRVLSRTLRSLSDIQDAKATVQKRPARSALQQEFEA